MGKVGWLWVGALALLAHTAAWGWFALTLAGGAGVYGGSLWWPTVAHRRCDMDGKRRKHAPGGRAYRVRGCRHPWCVHGDLVRLGVRVFQPGRARRVREELGG